MASKIRSVVIRRSPHRVLEYAIERRVRAEQTEQRIVRESLSIPGISDFNFSTLPSDRTLFILGSGGSIWGLNDDHFSHIRKNLSVGINYWIAHPFVPDILLFYPGTAYDYRDCHKKFQELFAYAPQSYSQTTKIVTDLEPFHHRFLQELPPPFRTNLYAAERFTSFARTKNELVASLGRHAQRDHFRQATEDRLYKYRASLTTALSIAVRIGVRKVVFCGVDLYNSEYFYYDHFRLPHLANSSFRQPNYTDGLHRTANVFSPHMLDIVTVVAGMASFLKITYGISVFVQNPNSLLSSAIPVYHFET